MTAEREMILSTGENDVTISDFRFRILDLKSAIRNPQSASSGFTLVELRVGMGILGLIIASSVPGMTGYARHVRLKAATREVLGLLSLARSMAISSRSVRTVVVNPDAHELLIEETLEQAEPRRVRLSSGVNVAVDIQGQSGSGPARLTFQPSGSLSGRSCSILLSNDTKQQTIRITATTGAISTK